MQNVMFTNCINRRLFLLQVMTVNYSLFLVSFSSHFGVHKAT